MRSRRRNVGSRRRKVKNRWRIVRSSGRKVRNRKRKVGGGMKKVGSRRRNEIVKQYLSQVWWGVWGRQQLLCLWFPLLPYDHLQLWSKYHRQRQQ